jgi:dTDP-4-dehydrorhamnose 3,5-epimerase
MTISETAIPGVYIITLTPFTDSRGFFMRTYDEEIFKRHGLLRHWVQENHSLTEKTGTIRGLHFQLAPFDETKLIRCFRGSIFDVAVDLRKNSPTFGKWTGTELSDENMKMLFIPGGFAHGFCTLKDKSEVIYKVNNFYTLEYERGIIYNDKDINIRWPVTDPILSAKDQKNMSLQEFIDKDLKYL